VGWVAEARTNSSLHARFTPRDNLATVGSHVKILGVRQTDDRPLRRHRPRPTPSQQSHCARNTHARHRELVAAGLISHGHISREQPTPPPPTSTSKLGHFRGRTRGRRKVPSSPSLPSGARQCPGLKVRLLCLSRPWCVCVCVVVACLARYQCIRGTQPGNTLSACTMGGVGRGAMSRCPRHE
jgi:hypothetical protein